MSDLPLPAPYYPQWSHSNEHAAYTADQMREYAAACVAAAVPQWQPIKTAPRDGTQVLAWHKGVGYWAAAYRLPMLGEPQNQTHYVHEWRDGGGRWASPTHWMPLPAAPEVPR